MSVNARALWQSLLISLVLQFIPCQGQQPRQTLRAHVRPAVSSGQAIPLAALQPTQRLNLSIVLPLRNPSELARLLSQIYDPSSPDYRHFLTVKEFADRFGPSADDYQKVVEFARINGFKVTGSPANRMIVPITGTVDQVQRAFNVGMRTYRHPAANRTFFSTDREPSVPANLKIAHIAGLNNFSLPMPMVKHEAASVLSESVQGSGPDGQYLASDMRAAYYGGTALTGRGQTVGLVQFDGYDINDVVKAFDGYATLSTSGADYAVNYTAPNSSTYTVPIHNVLLDGATGAPGQFYPPANDAEQVLDIVQAIGMAPGLSQIRVYIGINDVDILGSIASEDLANEISISWSWTPDDPSAVDPFFQEMAAQGQSVFVASGDYGAYSPANLYYFPQEDDWVTAVGGTSLTTSGPGSPLVAETAWKASGGGVSPDAIPIPGWQAGVANSSNGASATLRNVPDVAMESDADNYDCSMGSCSGGWAGTSFASPRWAGFIALVNEQAHAAGDPPVGFINPWIYSTGQSANYGSEFHDVASGMNDYEAGYGFYALPGYDLATGWGSPAGQNLVDAMAPRAAIGFQLSTTQSSLSINPGSSGTTTIGVTYTGGFSGDVSLAVTTPLPAGITASFDRNPTTGTSVLTFAASIFAVAQSYVVTVTGTSGTLQATTYVTINTPTNAVVILDPVVPVVPVTAELIKPGVLVPIHATVVGNPQGIHLRWAPGTNATSGWTTQGIALSQGLSAPFSNANIGTWDTTSVTAAGYYTIQLSVDYDQATISATTLVYLEPDLLSVNWPRWLDESPLAFAGIVPFDDADGNTWLSLVEPVTLNSSTPPRYRIFSPDGSSDQSTALSFGTYLNPAFGHLTPGDKGEVVLTDSRSALVIDNDGSLSSLPLNPGANVQFQGNQLVLADLKGDSSLAAITYGIDFETQNAYVYAWGSDGRLLANFPVEVPYKNQAALFNWNQGVAVGDIDGDGKQEIVALESLTTSTFTFALFSHDGSPRAWPVPTLEGIPFEMILTDLDGNGKLELVVAMQPPPETQVGVTRWALHVFQPDGSERRGWPVWLNGSPPYLAAGDLARTGKEQIVVSSFDLLFVLNGDGTSFSSQWPLETDGWKAFGPPVLADVDGDGYPEILVANGDYSFPQSSGGITSTSVSVLATGQKGLSQTGTKLAVSDPNATPGYHSAVLRAFHPDGTVVRSWNLLGMHGEQPWYTPRLTVGDFNHDGITDIAILNTILDGQWLREGMVEVLTTGTPYHPAANDWPMLYRDTYNSSIAYPSTDNSPHAATPAFSLTPGNYPYSLSVRITDSTPGAVIYYTTDGSTPTTNSTLFRGPIPVSAAETIRAIATTPGYSQSPVASAVYTITPPAATPTFSIAPGTYTTAQTLTVSDTTPGASIYYTTNGTTPTTSSNVYSGPITVSTSETIEAIATAAGYSQSAVATAAYVITPPAATPTFSVAPGTYTSAQSITISDSTPGATIYYTTNGTTSTTSSTRYSGPIPVFASETIAAIATADGYSQSAVATAAYIITPPAATPTFSIAPGTYTTIQTVAINDSTAGATIYYTINGSTPTTGSSVYTGPITVSASETIKAIASGGGHSQSPVATAKYTIILPADTPTFSVAPGAYTTPQTVAISDTTPGANIFYTTNGTAPTTSSTPYTGPITVAASETIEAIATASGYSQSAVATAAYTITPPSNPAPAVTSLSPPYVSAGSAALTLSISGSGFSTASTVYWASTALATHFVSPTQLTADVPASSMATTGIYSIQVQTPAPGGGTSNRFQFEVDSAQSVTSAPPSFSTDSLTVAAGSTAAYPVTISSSATAVSVSCLNLPAGAACTYSSTSGAVSITTSSTTPAGSYPITVVFSETLPGAASAIVILPVLLLPLVFARRRLALKGALLTTCVGAALFALAVVSIGCGGGSPSPITPPQNPTHQATRSGVVTLTIQ